MNLNNNNVLNIQESKTFSIYFSSNSTDYFLIVVYCGQVKFEEKGIKFINESIFQMSDRNLLKTTVSFEIIRDHSYLT